MSEKIAIYGAGGLGREVLSMIRQMPHLIPVGFYDDGKEKGSTVDDLPVLGGLDALIDHHEKINVVIAIGNPMIKKQVAERLRQAAGVRFISVIHPQAFIQDLQRLKIGAGAILTAGVKLTTGISVGDHVLLNLNCTIGHDVNIGACSSIMPGANIAGAVTIGHSVLIGSGANILNGVKVGNNCRVGAGAVVTKDVSEGITVVGVPATPLK
jgi:sugar O-acyltransferase (sialic acid O-acetyltransferase NeuD family)